MSESHRQFPLLDEVARDSGALSRRSPGAGSVRAQSSRPTDRGQRSGGGSQRNGRFSVGEEPGPGSKRIPKRMGPRMGMRIANGPFPAAPRGRW